ncbi:sigma factor-like helix-turn-helix DNA-binding protein [Nocardioides sp. MAHUQ-72]|uniref:sigma factor-like helix-turn-helix DNA-binding protein n=1 Tax=unclassified Nocardioides TaxID=2615069 RepID=UPI00361B61F9
MRHDSDFAAYMTARWPALVRTLVLLGSPQPEAEEIARQGLARCYLGWSRVRESLDIDVEVYRTVLDVLGRARARVGGRAAGSPETPASSGATQVVEPTDAVLLRIALEEALDGLPVEQREVVVLRYVAGLVEPQISALLGVPEDEVESSLATARDRLDLERLWEAPR